MRIFNREITLPQWTRLQWTGVIGGSVLVIALITYSIVMYVRRNSDTACEDTNSCESTPTPTASTLAPSPTPTPDLTASFLNGALVPKGSEKLRPLAVIIENHPDARPQSGLGSANVVYEAISEGGITRFMAVFADPRQAVKVGPVRSARTFFVDFATELGAPLAHVGGNIDALDQIRATGAYDLDQFANPGPYYRDSSRAVATEHTMYSSTEKLWELATVQKKYSPEAEYSPWKFEDDTAANNRPASQTATIKFSSASYDVEWRYDPATNSYTRYLAGKPHNDANTGSAISAKTIILQSVAHRDIKTRINEEGSILTLTGSGPVTIIKNGTTVKGEWRKEGTGRTKYYTESGDEIPLVRGVIWVEVVHSETSVTVK